MKTVGISTIGILLHGKSTSIVKKIAPKAVEFVMEFNEKNIIEGDFEKSLHAPHHYLNTAAVRDSALKFAEEEITKLFRFRLSVVVHEGRSITNFDGWKEKAFNRMEKLFLKLNETGHILVENVTPSSFFKDINEFFTFADRNDLNVCLDFSHVMANEGNLKNVFSMKDKFKERIKKFHISDTVYGKDRHLSLGTGIMPLKEIKAFLKEFDVPLINEAVMRESGDIVQFYKEEIKKTEALYE